MHCASDLFTLTIDILSYKSLRAQIYFLNKTQSVGIHFLNYISRKSLEIKLSRFTDFFSFSSPAGRQTHNAMFY